MEGRWWLGGRRVWVVCAGGGRLDAGTTICSNRNSVYSWAETLALIHVIIINSINLMLQPHMHLYCRHLLHWATCTASVSRMRPLMCKSGLCCLGLSVWCTPAGAHRCKFADVCKQSCRAHTADVCCCCSCCRRRCCTTATAATGASATTAAAAAATAAVATVATAATAATAAAVAVATAAAPAAVDAAATADAALPQLPAAAQGESQHLQQCDGRPGCGCGGRHVQAWRYR